MNTDQLDMLSGCNIDAATLQTDLFNIGEQLGSKLQQSSNTSGKLNDVIDLLATDSFFNSIKNYNNKLTQIKFNNLDCIRESDNRTTDDVCGPVNELLTNMNEVNLDKTIDVIKKYRLEFRRFIMNLISILTDFATSCQGDTSKIIKINKIISNLSLYLVNDVDFPDANGIMDIINIIPSNIFSMIGIFLLVLLVVGFLIGRMSC
jgi:hypothetical protein